MKKILIACLLLCMCTGKTGAQSPHYIVSKWGTTPVPYAINTFDASNNRLQSIYYPSDFPGMPKGNVTAVYFRTTPAGTVENVLYHNVSVRLGYTSSLNYPANGGWDTFKTPLTQVFNKATINFTGVTVQGNWIKFPVAGTWTYDPLKNTVVDIQHGIEIGSNFGGFNILSTNVGAKRLISGQKDSVRTFSILQSYYMDLGFDITPLGIEQQSNIVSFGVFPNPTPDGHFMISADAKQGLQKVAVSVSNAVGQLVYENSFQQTGSSLFKEIVLPNASPGIYFVELLADGERIARRITVQ